MPFEIDVNIMLGTGMKTKSVYSRIENSEVVREGVKILLEKEGMGRRV